ncbi:hypothetical protein GJAV_G00182760 [Gymnothorax javanicus]|nr:hypothetical protein GJAV_G00182760 [Gymnothorax javanicus]
MPPSQEEGVQAELIRAGRRRLQDARALQDPGRGQAIRELRACRRAPLHIALRQRPPTTTTTPPPPPPPLPPHKFALPWPLSYPAAAAGPFSSPMGERCSSNPTAWRDQCSEQAVGHHSRWQRREMPHSSYKSHYPTDSREMWSYYNAGKHNFSPSLLSHSPLFPQPPLYPKDLPDTRRSYSTKRPNGFDRWDDRHPPVVRQPSVMEDYLYDPKGKQSSSHTNGKRRPQDEPRPVCAAAVRDTHTSLQEKGLRAALKAPLPNASDTRPFKTPLDGPSAAGSPGEAHIYYALGPAYTGLQQPPLAYPLYSSHSPAPILPLSGLPTDASRPLRNSQLSPLVEAVGRHNSHSPDQRPTSKPQSQSSTPSGGYRSHSAATATGPHSGTPATSALIPQPPIFLPHFARGSLIELNGGRLKRVEDLQTEDFLLCANTSPDFHLSSCTVLLISPSPSAGFSHLQVLLTDSYTQEVLKVLVEYPFFVRDRGWSSCCPQRTAQLYGLPCRSLSVGDVCLALTPAPSPAAPPPASEETAPPGRAGHESSSRRAQSTAPPTPAPPIPAPQGPTQGRKRRWSAPELEGTASRTPADLPHASKQWKQQ